jgi:plastocyanin
MSHGSLISGNRRSDGNVLWQRHVAHLSLVLFALVSGLLLSVVQPAVTGERVLAVVDVKLTEFTIEMPRTITPGQVTFSVTNAGTMEHNFEIEGEGLEKSFETKLKPGETRNLQIDLPAGTYEVYCPVDDHQERGMRLEIKVAQQQSDGPRSRGRSAQHRATLEHAE